MRRKTKISTLGGSLFLLMVTGFVLWSLFLDPYANRFDAEYIGSEACSECHTQIYPEWKRSPHANMTRDPSPVSVVGNFDGGQWMLPPEARRPFEDEQPAAKMYSENGKYYMALRHPVTDDYVPFEIEHVIGYQYRQVYVTREPGGVLRRLPLQWSTRLQAYFPYWNLQEGSTPTLEDLWAQMGSQNSAWNLYCARCHTTHLTVESKNAQHTEADTHWVDDGIACEACHGPGSLHRDYFESNYINRLSAFLNSKLRGEDVAYVANARKLGKGPAMSVCARCHGSDILMGSTDIYRIYEPGRSREGRTNDLSAYFQQTPLTPGRNFPPTVEVWDDGEPRGIGMLFRSMIESRCYQDAEVRCYDCHNPHDNKQAAVPGILQPSAVSDSYCMNCHLEFRSNPQEHTHHPVGVEGSFCYDCHMPRVLTKLATGVLETTRTHKMSSIPSPANSLRFGMDGAPNACSQCHQDQTVQWSEDYMQEWYGTPVTESSLTPEATPAPAIVEMTQDSKSTAAEGQMTPQEQITHAQADLANRLGLDPAEVTVITSGPVTWRSGALGCPKPGMSYTQALVPGFRITLQAGKTSYYYHAKSGGQPFHCPQDRIESPSQDRAYE